MFRLGEYNTLTIDRSTSVGLYLRDEEGNDVLLPNKYVDPSYKIGDSIQVFVYKDHEQRWIATTLKPAVTLNHFAALRVRSVSEQGAFLEWGLEKDIFVPYREQSRKMLAGQRYVIYLYEDEKTNRLVASSKINKFLQNEDLDLEPGQEVDILVYETTPLGYNCVVNQKYKGLIYHNEIFTDVRVGSEMKAWVKAIRDDDTVDLSLQPKGMQRLEGGAEQILHYLQTHKGLLPLTDSSAPEDISRLLKMSKKTFKRSVGILLKQKLVSLHEDGVRLVK